jgi:hypothetical protein
MLKQALVAARFAIAALAFCICVQARADGVAAWPVSCSAPRVGLEQLRFEFDLTDISNIEGLDTSKLASRMAVMRVPSWWAKSPTPISRANEFGAGARMTSSHRIQVESALA